MSNTMIDQSRRLIKTISEQFKRYQRLNDPTAAIERTAEKLQKRLAGVQNIATEKYNTIVKQMDRSTIIQNLNAPPLELSKPVPQKIIVWWHWYQQLTGLDHVELTKNQVILVQNKLFECQEHRRELTSQAMLLSEKLKEIYGELIQTKRDDPKYVQLTISENKSLQEHGRIIEQLKLLEGAERDHFTQLATTIKEYHDAQTMNAQKFKYLSIIASTALALISVIASMIYNNRRIVDVRNVILKAQQQNESVLTRYFNSFEKELEKKLSGLTNRPSVTYSFPEKKTSSVEDIQGFVTTNIIPITLCTIAFLIISKMISG